MGGILAIGAALAAIFFIPKIQALMETDPEKTPTPSIAGYTVTAAKTETKKATNPDTGEKVYEIYAVDVSTKTGWWDQRAGVPVATSDQPIGAISGVIGVNPNTKEVVTVGAEWWRNTKYDNNGVYDPLGLSG